MATVGAGAAVGVLSYLAVGKESTYGTYATCTAGLSFLSAGLIATKEVKILEEIQTTRTNSNWVSLGKTVEGDIECYASPQTPAFAYFLINAMGGGAVSSATATGETVGGLGFTHTLSINNFAGSYGSLSINVRKGDVVGGKVFEYTGVRVNEFSLAAELDDALKATFSVMAKDVTTTTNDVSAGLDAYANKGILSFQSGRLSVESSLASLTSSTFWHIQSMSFKINNNLNADTRRIGSDVLTALPPGLANIELTCTMRFDTVTAWNHMMAADRLSAEFEFLGPTMTGSGIREGIKMVMPYVIVSNAGDPEIGGPNEMLTSEVTFAVVRDPTTSGYAVKAYLTNLTASY